MPMVRRFRAHYIFRGDATGIGIVEYGKYWDRETIAIQSLYIDNRISNRDAIILILQRIYNDLGDDEGAIVQMMKYPRRRGYDIPYKSKLNAQYVPRQRGLIQQATILAQDALDRKNDITEIFDKSIEFSVIESEKENRINEGKT